MPKLKYIKVRYKGTEYRITKSDLPIEELPGVRVQKKGIIFIVLFNHCKGYKRRLAFHRLITGRGLRDIRRNLNE